MTYRMCDRVVNTPGSYFGGLVTEFQPGIRLSRGFRAFLQTVTEHRGKVGIIPA
jgi:hypothetical protein